MLRLFCTVFFLHLSLNEAFANKLTLSEALSLVERTDPDLSVSSSKVTESEAAVKGARSAHWPTVSARAAQSLHGGSYGIFLTQSIYSGGETSAKVAVAKKTRELSIIEQQETKRAARIKVINAFYETLFALHRLNLSSDLANQLQKILKDSESAWINRAISRSEYLEIQLNAQRIQERRGEDELALRSGIRVLRDLLKLHTLEPQDLEGTLSVNKLNKLDTREVLQKVKQNSTLVIKAQTLVEKMNSEEDQVLSADLPRLSVVSSYQVDRDFTLIRDTSNTGNFTAYLLLTVPLFSGFSRYHTKDVFTQRRTQVELQKNKAEMTQEQEVTAFLEKLASIEKILATVKERGAINQDMTQEVDKLYKAKMISSQSWFNSKMLSMELQLKQFQLIKDYLVTRGMLEQVMEPLAMNFG